MKDAVCVSGSSVKDVVCVSEFALGVVPVLSLVVASVESSTLSAAVVSLPALSVALSLTP